MGKYGNGRVVNNSSYRVWVIENDSGRPVAHILDPGFQSPSGVDADGVMPFDPGTTIDGWNKWWKVRDIDLGVVTDSGGPGYLSLSCALGLCTRVPALEFGEPQFDFANGWGEPIPTAGGTPDVTHWGGGTSTDGGVTFQGGYGTTAAGLGKVQIGDNFGSLFALNQDHTWVGLTNGRGGQSFIAYDLALPPYFSGRWAEDAGLSVTLYGQDGRPLATLLGLSPRQPPPQSGAVTGWRCPPTPPFWSFLP
jgi:hypothetical protein